MHTGATGVRECEWSIKPSLNTFGEAVQLIKNDSTNTHNLIEIRNPDEFHEFCTIWKAFGNPGSVTLLLTGQATNLNHDGIKTQKTISRGKWGSQVEQVGLLRLGDAAKCPWNKAMTQVPREKILWSATANAPFASWRLKDTGKFFFARTTLPCKSSVTLRARLKHKSLN